jgi:signal peptidase I
MDFFKRRKIRKQLKALLHHARTLRASREDILTSGQLAFLDEHVEHAISAIAGGDIDAMTKEGEALDACMTKLVPPKSYDWWRENFDVLVVAIGVAMAFRAYFYQPFKIPTGSMQPTLYGIHSESRPATDMTWFDRQPLKFAKWLVTGESFKVIRAKDRGTVSIQSSDSSRKPGYSPVIVAGQPYYVPNDVVELGMMGLKDGVRNGQSVKPGDVLWSGIVRSGDFLFVNRWKWNFCHPKRGEIMVFATSNIPLLQQGTHYIKRMTGLPGDTLQIKAPNLLVNGVAVTEPERLGQIARCEKIADWAPPYAGFNPSGAPRFTFPGKTLATENDSVTLPPGYYYAMGDNSHNSFDSRFWGPVPERNLLGPASVVHWPFTSPRWGWIK